MSSLNPFSCLQDQDLDLDQTQGKGQDVRVHVSQGLKKQSFIPDQKVMDDSGSLAKDQWETVGKSKLGRRKDLMLEKTRKVKEEDERKKSEIKETEYRKFIIAFWSAFEQFVGGHAPEKEMQCLQETENGTRTYKHHNVDDSGDEIEVYGEITVTPPSSIPEKQGNKISKHEYKFYRHYYCLGISDGFKANITAYGPGPEYKKHTQKDVRCSSLKDLSWVYTRARSLAEGKDEFPWYSTDSDCSDSDSE